MGKNHFSARFFDSCDIFFNGIVAAKQRGTDLLRCQQKVHKFRYSAQEYRNLIPLAESDCSERTRCFVNLFIYLMPCDICPIIMHRYDRFPWTLFF